MKQPSKSFHELSDGGMWFFHSLRTVCNIALRACVYTMCIYYPICVHFMSIYVRRRTTLAQLCGGFTFLVCVGALGSLGI
jgi:hypothetical protein